jgi:hypothetical protein
LRCQEQLHTRQRPLRSFRVVRLRGIPRFAFELLFVHIVVRACRLAAHGL